MGRSGALAVLLACTCATAGIARSAAAPAWQGDDLRGDVSSPMDLGEPAGPAVEPRGDCDDTDPTVHLGHPEVAFNRIDDDCDGLADEDAQGNPSTDPIDMDSDGISIAAGDCNDVTASVRPGTAEVVGNLRDDNCDGRADESAQGISSPDVADHDGDGVTMNGDRIFATGFEG